jgi:transcriptional regulator with XRE-family HTH domain
LLAAGRQMRQAREARGLSLRQLAMQTRISTAVLEALERGWRDRLPEAAYLRTMLPLIEAELGLTHGSLTPALPSDPGLATNRRNQRRFTPGSIDVFSSWQGTVLYGVLTLGLVYALNLEQQRLAAAGRLALRPVPLLPASEQNKPQQPGASLLKAYPELRPLELAARGQGLRQLAREPGTAPFTPGLLELRLTQTSRVMLRGDDGSSSNFDAVQGQLRLPLAGPFRLEINPPPEAGGQVLWDGQALGPISGRPGQFAVPVPDPPRPAAAASRP